jgi:hypothetical protein
MSQVEDAKTPPSSAAIISHWASHGEAANTGLTKRINKITIPIEINQSLLLLFKNPPIFFNS